MYPREFSEKWRVPLKFYSNESNLSQVILLLMQDI